MIQQKPIESYDDAVELVMSRMSHSQTEQLRGLKKEELISAHFDFGLWVRNTLGHWTPPISEGTYDPIHPDDVSTRITEMIWERLQDIK